MTPLAELDSALGPLSTTTLKGVSVRLGSSLGMSSLGFSSAIGEGRFHRRHV